MLGYVRDPGNPFVFFEVRLPCKYRQVGKRDCNCPGKTLIEFPICQLGIPIKAQTCNKCLKRVEPIDVPVMRAMWQEFHTATPPAQLESFIDRVPCKECKAHFKLLIKQNPQHPNEPWFDYKVRLHDLVNHSLGKPQFGIEAAKVLYGHA